MVVRRRAKVTPRGSFRAASPRLVRGLVLALALFACSGGPADGAGSSADAGPDAGANARPDAGEDPGKDGFDERRALGELRELVAIGERYSGSPGAERARALIGQRLRQAGWVVREHAFRVTDPRGTAVEMANVIGRRAGRGDGTVMLVTHYDTKRIDGVRFVGANDGASGVAVLLEIARQLAAVPLRPSVELVFFDGEEAFGDSITDRDGLYGSRALAEQMERSGELARVEALILVDMVGDRDLELVRDRGSSPALRRRLARIARSRGLEALLAGPTLQVIDDHRPFADRGVREVLALIDFQYGADWSPGPHWHTAADTLDKVSAASLNSLGVVVVELLEELVSARRIEGANRPSGAYFAGASSGPGLQRARATRRRKRGTR